MFAKIEQIVHSVFRALVVTLIFVLAYEFHNYELVREGVGDKGFDMLNKALSTQSKQTAQSSPVLLFSYDNAYMLEHGLFDDDNHTNYGNLFHRSRIVDFITQLDEKSKRLKRYNRPTPKAFFLDFDITFTLMPDGKTLSSQDQALLDVLKVERDYTIVLPKTQIANFIEHSNDEQIQDLVKSKKIIFASVGFSVSKDHTVRRYRAYETFHEDGKERTYVNANIVLWKLANDGEINSSEIVKHFKQNNVVSNRILLKGYQESLPIQSYWQSYKHYSVLRHMSQEANMVTDKAYENAIVMLGTSYKNNGDTFQVLNVFGSQTMTGGELHANTLMTLFAFDGQLQLLPVGLTIFIVFTLIFTVDFVLRKLLRRWKKEESSWTFIVVLVLSVLLMFLISWELLHFGYWFDWFAPTVLFDILL
jgi:hypothetical protein